MDNQQIDTLVANLRDALKLNRMERDDWSEAFNVLGLALAKKQIGAIVFGETLDKDYWIAQATERGYFIKDKGGFVELYK